MGPKMRKHMKLILKLGVILLSVLSKHAFSATVIIYHHVSESSPKSTSVTPDQFKQHMDLIEELDLTVVPLTKIADRIRNNQHIEPNWLAITFDDGYRNVYDEALPILKQRNWPFTVFVNPDMVKPSKLYMDWAQLKELTLHNGHIANHTLSHENLVRDDLSIQDIETNLLTSEEKIKKETGQSSRMLAYPYGEYNDEIKALLAKHDFIGFAQHSGAINQTSDRYALTRFPANGIYANPKTLRAKLKSLPFSFKNNAPTDTNPSSRTPEWTVFLSNKDFYQSQLACFITGQSKPVKPVWHDKLSFTIRSESEIGQGRVKYNCTAPSIKHMGRYYWTSKLWISP